MSARAIGWVGAGVMGRFMAGRLLGAGHEVVVTTRTRAKADELLRAGAGWVERPSELVVRCATVVTMVGYPKDVEDVYFGRDGLIPRLGVGAAATLLIDMTTSAPALAARIGAAAAARGVDALDAPVSGGDIGAREGTLSIMVGGTRGAFERASPIFAHLGRKIVHQGDAGSGQHTKLVNQILIASNMIGVCEGLLYAERAGLDPVRVLDSVSSGAAASWSLANLAPRMLKGDFEPGFFVEHFLKDMGIALEEARRLGLALPGLALARRLYDSAQAQGLGRKGTHALLVALRTEARAEAGA